MKCIKPIVKVGNSHIIRLPKKQLDKAGLNEGDSVEINYKRAKSPKIIIKEQTLKKRCHNHN